MVRRISALLAVLAALCIGVAPAVADSVTVSPSPGSNAPNIGKVSSANTGTTVFSVDSSGNVTRVSGSAVRISTGTTTTPTVTLLCNGSCSGTLAVTITSTGSGRASISQFSVASLSGTTFNGSAPTPASPLSFTLNNHKQVNITFLLPMQISLGAGSNTGSLTAPYTVSVVEH